MGNINGLGLPVGVSQQLSGNNYNNQGGDQQMNSQDVSGGMLSNTQISN